MKNVTILAAFVALPMLATSAQAGEYGQGIQYGPERNAVQQQFDQAQYERSHYRSTRVVARPFPLPRFSANAPDRSRHYHRDAHGRVVADCDSGRCRSHSQLSPFAYLKLAIGGRHGRKRH